MKHRSLFSCMMLVLITSAWSHPLTNPSDVIDVTHYYFTIELNDSTDEISGKAEITFRARKAVRAFELDLINRGADGKGMSVEKVRSKHGNLKFSQQGDRVIITLINELPAGEQIGVNIEYSGIPRDGLIISKNKFGERTFFADNWPNRGRNWLPVVDHPADKATVNFHVIAPLHYEVVANGVRIQESYLNNKQKETMYEETTPISTKVMVIGVARFAVEQAGVVNHIPVETWVYPQNKKEGFYDYALAVNVLDFFNSHIGEYPYKKLANVQSKTTFGGLENASAIFYFENSVTGKAAHEDLIAHEIAHQWFGNSATETDWAHVWLSEGFATYFALIYSEFKHGIDTRKAKMAEDRQQVLSFAQKGLSPIVNTTITDPMKMLNANSYQKGSWVLHMLRQEIGDKQFWEGIRAYYRQYRDSNADTNDFKKIMEAVSGRDLDYFFDQWIFKAGHPVLDGNWTYDAKNKTVSVNIRQLQKGVIFQFPLQVAIFKENEDVPVIEMVTIDGTAKNFKLQVASKPLKIELDPDVNLLFEGNMQN